jgi:hypothetical protein
VNIKKKKFESGGDEYLYSFMKRKGFMAGGLYAEGVSSKLEKIKKQKEIDFMKSKIIPYEKRIKQNKNGNKTIL